MSPTKHHSVYQFKELGQAYEVLGDAEKRNIYDDSGEDAVREGRRGHDPRKRGEDVIHPNPIKVSLEDLYNGGTSKKFSLSRNVLCPTCFDVAGEPINDEDPCRQCKGEKVVKEKKFLDVQIEKGMQNGHKIAFSGEADESPDCVAGDVVFVLQQKEHPKFKRKGDDLYVEQTLFLAEALCGFQFVLTHLDGRQLHIKSDPGEIARPDQFRAVGDEGMPMFRRPSMRGNLYTHFTVEFPDALTPDQCKALEAILPRRARSPPTHIELNECVETTMLDCVDAHQSLPDQEAARQSQQAPEEAQKSQQAPEEAQKSQQAPEEARKSHGAGGDHDPIIDIIENRGEDVIRPIIASLEDLYNGGRSKKFSLSRTLLCSTCEGTGETINHKDRCPQCKGEKVVGENKFLEVHIEKGMQDGQKITFSGEADEAPDILTGDIVFVLQQKEHPKFKRKGDNLYVEHTLFLTEALCGFQFVLTHLDGRHLLIKSNPGKVVKPDQYKAIIDEGMPMYQRPLMRGKLFIHFTVVFPDALTPEQCKKLEGILPLRARSQLADGH